MKMIPVFLILLCFTVALSGCEKKLQERHYSEVVIKPSMMKSVSMNEDPHAGLGLNIPSMTDSRRQESNLQWTVPAGWQEEPGNGMRVATFKLKGDPDAIDVSIVSLGGMAGGLEANLSRWATQLDIKLAADEDLPRLIASAGSVEVARGIQAKVFDFSTLQKGQPDSAKSMIAAMIEFNDATVFVKMTGTLDNLRLNKNSFEELAKSVRKK